MTSLRVRREPPAFRTVEVARVEPLSPRMARVTLAGPELDGFVVDQPAASVRLLLPTSEGLVIPTWTGNEFLLPGGARPTLRTLTPRRVDHGGRQLDVDIVLHGRGAASEWAESAVPGARVAVSGPGRGYPVDEEAPGFFLAGDETAIPGIGQLLEVLPPDRPVEVHVEVAEPDGRVELPEHPRATVTWHDLPPGTPPGSALVAAVCSVDLAPEARVWVAGEAAAVQRIRKHLFGDGGLPRRQATIRGYWKHGRAGDADDD